MRRLGAPLLLLLLALSGAEARGAELVLSLSKARVTITSNFTGDTLVLFGVIAPGAASAGTGTPDVIVTVRGPSESFTTWRKERFLGLWVNVDSRSFLAAPAYLAVLASRAPALMATPDILRREQAGLDNNRLLQRIGSDYADVVPEDPFRQAFLRVKQAQGLYFERPAGVEFIAPNVFRASIPIPGSAPIGTYEVVVKTFADGALVARGTLGFEVAKVDFEQTVATAAQNHPWLYGIVTALAALCVGFIANIVFRRD
ncbi:TIGR02186 family protein [Ancylobacter dichloromethanicus]|uniref:Membrane protein n=1 Tax=Ancylobacter dichloromethanicus TaxID=518825 RepID=A0A9W6JBJ0_9HYPH|nr:TIGR02186 family protein [Ancylobacter dichloromethanicus]MBS7552480.1 TIGR02186 family protein [Ancylobacter dichloromethanicus]GLK74222.1 membrane protein [Ancylobacter dichloromethanicus]